MPAAVLPSNALTTLGALKDELGIDATDESQDARLARLIGVASDFIQRWCGRKFGKLQRTEYYKGYGTPLMYLRVPPIDAAADLTVVLRDPVSSDAAQEFVQGIDFRIEDHELGTLWRPGGWEKTAPLVAGASYEALDGMEAALWAVTYTGGYVLRKDETTGPPAVVRTLPYDIEQVCLELITTKQQAQGRDRAITSERLLSWSASYGANDLTESMVAALSPYKVLVV